MSFGDEIKRIRTKDLNMTLDQLSKASGLSKGFLSKLENNKQDISRVDNIKKLAVGLNVSYNELLHAAGYIDLEEVMYERDYFNSIEEYKELEYPDIKCILNKNEVYFNKRPLNKEYRIKIKNILIDLTKDLEVNYPSSERIEEEHNKFMKSHESIKRKNNKEGE